MSEDNYILHLSEPWFTLINLGLKTVEGRKNSGKYADMKVGEIIKWTNDDFDYRSCRTKIIRKEVYETFQEYLEKEGLINCLPGMPDMDTGLSVYYKYYTRYEEGKFGVVAIKLELIK
jgi:ASC-1-like (ASCH) protein